MISGALSLKWRIVCVIARLPYLALLHFLIYSLQWHTEPPPSRSLDLRWKHTRFWFQILLTLLFCLNLYDRFDLALHLSGVVLHLFLFCNCSYSTVCSLYVYVGLLPALLPSALCNDNFSRYTLPSCWLIPCSRIKSNSAYIHTSVSMLLVSRAAFFLNALFCLLQLPFFLSYIIE